MNQLEELLKNAEYVAVTADIWTAKNRRILGSTVNWVKINFLYFNFIFLNNGVEVSKVKINEMCFCFEK